jgi:hypothetical protein
MKQQEDSERQANPELQAPAKKPYRKPAVRYERVFETQALTCGKVQSTQSGCRLNRKNS